MTNLEKLAMNATKMRYRSGELSGEDYHKILENAKEKGSDLDRRINSKQTFREFHPDASKELSISSKQNSLELYPYMTKEFYNKQSNRYKNYNPYRSMEDSIRVNDELERQKNILSGKIQNGVNNVRQKASDALASAGKKIKAWGNNIMNSTNTATAQPVTPNPAPATPPTSTAANTAHKNSFMRRAANAAKGVPGKIKAMPTGGKVALGAGIAGAALAGGAMLAHHNKKKKEEQMNRIASMEERLMEKTAETAEEKYRRIGSSVGRLAMIAPALGIYFSDNPIHKDPPKYPLYYRKDEPILEHAEKSIILGAAAGRLGDSVGGKIGGAIGRRVDKKRRQKKAEIEKEAGYGLMDTLKPKQNRISIQINNAPASAQGQQSQSLRQKIKNSDATKAINNTANRVAEHLKSDKPYGILPDKYTHDPRKSAGFWKPSNF